jgi:hypothetical protein
VNKYLKYEHRFTLHFAIERVKKNIQLFQAFIKLYSVPNSKCQVLIHENFGQSEAGILSAFDFLRKELEMYIRINQ